MTFIHIGKAIKTDLPSMGVAETQAFLKDIISTNDPEKAITCGFFRMEHSKPLKYTYTYDEMKFIVEGEMWITDENHETVKAVAGDVFYFPKGSEIIFDSPTYGIGFFCGLRKEGEA